jgi:ribosomal protein S18 acetylase RimI-like enzyme
MSFAFEVTESAMRQYVEQTWGSWQVDMQRESHDKAFDLETHSIVLVDDAPAGIVAIKEAPDHIQLEKLYLLPHIRNRGIGTELLRLVAARSVATNKPVHLRVLRVNGPAQRFYARHGFVVTAETHERVFMTAHTVAGSTGR